MAQNAPRQMGRRSSPPQIRCAHPNDQKGPFLLVDWQALPMVKTGVGRKLGGDTHGGRAGPSRGLCPSFWAAETQAQFCPALGRATPETTHRVQVRPAPPSRPSPLPVSQCSLHLMFLRHQLAWLPVGARLGAAPLTTSVEGPMDTIRWVGGCKPRPRNAY